VTRDPNEKGERALLNYGHTVGHAVEMAAGLSHGNAVAVGMAAAGRASTLTLGFADEERQRQVIAGLGLPVAAPQADKAGVLRLLALDKKRDTEGLRMVLLRAIGEPQVEHVGSATVGEALGAIGI
jgi:3-dehydroquinate synthetase